ncbi:MAG: choice-of-anchor D domain-containing protein [Bacteroidetes bacterium]|nr:choice-of-anchor D domain-containing protein [Bacteroidota bacterium]
MKKAVSAWHPALSMLLGILYLAGSLAAQIPPLPSSPASWSVVASYTIPGKASGLAWDGTYIYFGIYGVNGGNIYRFNPADGTYALQCTGTFDDAFGLTFKGPDLVTISQPSSSSQPAVALEFSMSGSQVSTITLPDHYMSGIAHDNGSYWVCTYYPDPGLVYHINASGTVLSQFVSPNAQPWDICLQGSDLWIADYYGNMVYKVTTTGTVLDSHPSQIPKPSGIVYDGTYLWYCAGELGANSTLYKVDLLGSGTPVITVPVVAHNYGTVTVGSSPVWNCQVQNTGTANLVINSIGLIPGQPVSTSFSVPATIAPGNSVNIPFAYHPLVPGALNTEAYINSGDPIHPSVTVTLTGNAVISGPHINITDTSHNWGDRRKGAYSRWYLDVSNNGSQPLTISTLTCADPHFIIDASVVLPLSVQPLQTTKIGVWFHSTEGIPYATTLAVHSNDPTQDPFIVHLQGTGVDTVYPVGTPLWTYFISGSFDTSPKGIRPLQDITGDGVDDVVIASEDNYVRGFNGNSSGDADLMWATEIYSGNVYQQNAMATINDIDGDGNRDIVVGTTGGDRSVRALSGKTGLMLWRYDTHAFGGGGWVYQVDTKYDYNNDGSPDVLACAGDDGNMTGPRRVFCLDGITGLPIWICPAEGAVFSVTGVEDFTGDGKPDVVAGATNASQAQSRVYGINGTNGAIMWTNIPAGSSVWALLQVDDMTGDGIKDIASGDYAGSVNFHNAVTGFREKTTLVQSNAIILRFQDMGDVNKDGHPDFLVAHSGAKGVMINGYDASILWEKPLADKSWNVANMGDITWDGTSDAAIGTLYQDNRTYFMDGSNGETLKSVIGNTPIDALDAIPDIVGDNSMELVVGGRNGGVACLSGGYDSTLIAVPGRENLHGNLVSVYPNPCGDVLHVAVNLHRRSDVNLAVTGITGRLVYTASFKNVNPGKQVYDLAPGLFKGEAVSGIYILAVETGEGIQHIKVVCK